MMKNSDSTTVLDESCCRLAAILLSIAYLYLAGSSSRLEWSGVECRLPSHYSFTHGPERLASPGVAVRYMYKLPTSW